MRRTLSWLAAAVSLEACQGPSHFQGACSAEQACEAGLECLPRATSGADGGCLADTSICSVRCSTDDECTPLSTRGACVTDCAHPDRGHCVAPVPKD